MNGTPPKGSGGNRPIAGTLCRDGSRETSIQRTSVRFGMTGRIEIASCEQLVATGIESR
jgi:hypothetical protein